MRVVGWLVWFAGGAPPLSSRNFWMSELPLEGCLGIVQFYEDGRRDLLPGGDWWYWDVDRKRWDRVPYHPEPGKWAPRPDAAIVLQGQLVSDEEAAEVERQMWRSSWP